MLSATVSGSASFHRFAASCQRAAGPVLDKELTRGLKEAGEDLAQAVHTASPIFMPSGYEELFAARMLSQVEVSRVRRQVTVIVYAKGRSGRRDVIRLNRGILKHPVYGRYRVLKSGLRQANPWRVTNIRPGFFDVPIQFGQARAFKRLDQAVGRVLDSVHA